MEFSTEVSASLKVLGAVNEEDTFIKIINQAFADVCSINKGSSKHDACCSSGLYTSAVALLLEMSKRNYSSDQLAAVLRDLDWPDSRVSSTTARYRTQCSGIRTSLSGFSTLLPHLVDIDWKLQHNVEARPGVKEKEGMYLIRLKVRGCNLANGASGFPAGMTSINIDTPSSSIQTEEEGTSKIPASPQDKDSDLETITLQCSLPQLITITDTLRQATASINKFAASS